VQLTEGRGNIRNAYSLIDFAAKRLQGKTVSDLPVVVICIPKQEELMHEYTLPKRMTLHDFASKFDMLTHQYSGVESSKPTSSAPFPNWL